MLRTIQPKMFAFLEGKVATDQAALAAIAAKDARALFIRVAILCEGIREVGGNNSGPMVELIQRTLGGADKEAWCMSLVQTCLAYVEKKLGITSPIAASEHCLTVWADTPKEQRVKTIPAPGAIIIWRHGASTSGHTGVTVAPVVSDSFQAVEGNTESGIVGGKVERDGGGVYLTKRSMDGAGTMKIVGFLKPFAVPA